jgi:Ca2+-binding EF-hand superfamily protein
MADTVAKWEAMQIKTFSNWVNMHLAKRGKKIDTVVEDFKTGVNLIQLLEIIGESTIPKYVAQPKMRIQMIENLGKALKFIEEHNVKLASIGPEAIVDGNKVQTLGMVWTLILRFAISDLSDEGLSAKQGLLLWCQKKTQGYKGVDVKDFQDSFKDGLAFCALIHRHRPDLLSYDGLSKDDPRGNLNLAFDVAAQHLGIPKLLDTEDIVSMPRPDERSIMTYVAALYKVFSQSDKAELAGRRLAKYINLMKAAQEMIHDYEERARALRAFIDEQTGVYRGMAPADDYLGVRGQIAAFKTYRKDIKHPKINEQQDLAVLLSIIQSKLASLNRPAYVPPAGLNTQELEEAMDALTTLEREYRVKLNAKMRAILENLRQEFAKPANEFFQQLNGFKAVVTSASGALADQLALLRGKRQELSTIAPQLEVIRRAEEACDKANIEENEYSDHTYEDLQTSYDQMVRIFDKKIAMIESQLHETKGGVPPEKMAEFQASFTHFDLNRDGHLDRLEFKSCLASLGLIDVDFSSSDPTSERLFNEVSQGNNFITFEQYVHYMISLTEDTVDPAQLSQSFRVVSGEKDFVTEDDMRRGQLSQDQIDFVKSSCPAHAAGGYDFAKWLS